MSEIESKEIKLEIGLPENGFPKTMYCNQFRVEREKGFCLVQFGLLTAAGLLDCCSCVFSREILQQHRETLLGYLNRIGRPKQTAPPPWRGALVEQQTQVADIITMAFRGEIAETCLFLFSLNTASRLEKGSVRTKPVMAQALVLLRSPVELQKQLIIALYEE